MIPRHREKYHIIDICCDWARLGARRRYERAQRKAEGKRLERVKEKGSKRLLQEGVLYLMVVNMPTEQELEKAKKEIREAKGKKTAKKNNTAVQ